MKIKLVLLALAPVFLLGAFTLQFAMTAPQEASDVLSHQDSLALVRTLGTVEATVKSKEQKYLSLEALLQHAHLKRQRERIVLTDAATGTIKNYKLTLIASVDGQHFQISLVPQSGCSVALFSSDGFLIYEGKALGCNGQ